MHTLLRGLALLNAMAARITDGLWSVEHWVEFYGVGASAVKAKDETKTLKDPINLSKSPVHFTPTGSIEPVTQRGRAHPDVKGRLAGEARMTKSPPHAGEMHPDGDELLYLVEGAVDVVLDQEIGERCLSIQPGQAFVVPRGVWHRVMVKEPCCLLYFTPGRSQVRWKRSTHSR